MDGRYLVRWGDDQQGFGVAGFGLLNELEREGFDAGAVAVYGPAVVPHRVLRLDEATATVNYVIGPDMIERWRATAGAVEVAWVDLRSNEERGRYDRLHDEVTGALVAAGRGDLVARLDQDVFMVAMDPDLPPDVTAPARAMYDLGMPAAVFVAPPETG